MFRSPADIPGLDQETRRAWAYKARLRDEAKARRRRTITGIVLALIVAAGAIYWFLVRR